MLFFFVLFDCLLVGWLVVGSLVGWFVGWLCLGFGLFLNSPEIQAGKAGKSRDVITQSMKSKSKQINSLIMAKVCPKPNHPKLPLQTHQNLLVQKRPHKLQKNIPQAKTSSPKYAP